ncbi:hypothetical protein MNY64_06660 [Moellerella wisconsensis]|uniref:hypothetical protein n=1 Tax=Moellerella wisconsensis TaxID=158849 RepID=UPI001F4EF083|nr:hypothetical protein [Moellerella wisconsensis]UNH28466.1 hypothetical protein MNY64_06660 [Moellerella wisconsensis]
MTTVDKNKIEMLIESPQIHTATLLTLLSTWCAGEDDDDTRNMISVAITVACQIEASLKRAEEGKL